jgi:hypothetical protein
MNIATLSPLLTGMPFQAALYADANDRVKHLHNMERLAEEIHRPMQEITPLYEDILAYMKSKARIQDYLPILVSKRVKSLLKN